MILTCKKHPEVVVEVTEEKKEFQPISWAEIPNCALLRVETPGKHNGCEVVEK